MRKAELFFIAFLLIVGLFSNGSLAQGYTQWNLPEGATTQEPIIIDDTRQRVLALALSPNGKILAHARTLPMTVNTTVYLYSTETGETLRILKAFTDQITNLAFSPDGKTIAGGNREAIHLWDTSTGTQLRVCTLERLAVSVTLVFSPDSSILISAARGTVVEFPDGAVRLAGGGWLSEATSVHGGGSIQLWEAHTGALLSTYTGHTDRVQTLTFSKDEKTLASGSADGTILLWDWETLKKANNR